jgi:hypothetical protein
VVLSEGEFFSKQASTPGKVEFLLMIADWREPSAFPFEDDFAERDIHRGFEQPRLVHQPQVHDVCDGCEGDA